MTETPPAPLLTIAIPTWNRAPFLAELLQVLQAQRATLPPDSVELLVCDNHADDETPEVVESMQRPGLPIRHVRHAENLGSDRNVAACHNLARGRYVWILGDDDLPLEGYLLRLLDLLAGGEVALLHMRPYGFEKDPLAELPYSRNVWRSDSAARDFVRHVGAQITLLSAIIYNRRSCGDVDAETFCGSNLVHVNLYLLATRRPGRYIRDRRYGLAYRKNNGGGYDFSKVFVSNLHAILLQHEAQGLDRALRPALERRMLTQYFPQHVMMQRRRPSIDLAAARERFRAVHARYLRYWVLVEPIFALPRGAAIAWGMAATLVGRVASGDLVRGLFFLRNRLKRTWLNQPSP